MKHYIAKYESKGNHLEHTEVFIKAETLVEAQDKFFLYLKNTPLYSHMWRLNLEIREIQSFPEVL